MLATKYSGGDHSSFDPFRARSVVPERAQDPFLRMMVIRINKAILPGIYPGDHSVATEHALSRFGRYKSKDESNSRNGLIIIN
jgi:hypothetical protein